MPKDFLNLNEENKETLSDRLLKASANATSALLTIAPLDDAVNTAIKMIGEALETDRVSVIENFDCPEQPLPCWKMLYEWHSPDTVSQISHLEVSQGTYEGIESWYESLNQGQSITYLTKDMPEPFRSGQEKLGVKALHVVPIFVENKCWGLVGFDDCREVKHRDQSELSVLKIAANSIGSAIQRDRTQKALLRSEQEKATELESINTELQQALNCLKITEERFRTLFESSSEGFYFAEVDPPVSTTLSIDEQCEQLYHNIRVVEANPAFAAMYGIDNPDDCIGIKNSDVHIPDSGKNAAFIRGLVENGYCFRDLETEEIDSHGQPRYFLNGGSLTIKGGYVVGGWSSQVDITQLRQTQQALLIKEKQRTAELEKINDTLSRSLTWLAREENLNSFLEQTLLEISATVQADLAHLFVLHQPDRMLEVVARVINGELIQKPSPSEPAIFSTPFSADITPLFSIMEEQNLVLIEDVAHLPPELKAVAWPDSIESHIRGGYKACGILVLKTGDRSVGFLGLSFNEKLELVEEKRQLVIALANQAALAILLIQLSEQSKQAALYAERNRLAGEIHDTIAQAFTGISLQLGVAKWLLNEDPKTIAPILDRINDIAQTGLAEARRSVWEIYPTAQEYSNLAEKLSQSVEKLTRDCPIQVDLQILGSEYQVSAMVGYNLLKLSQEAITNALKHAKATKLSIALTYQNALVSLRITDDGCGFQPNLDNGGFGLLSISERSDRIGGQLLINSILGKGTEILVEIPLEEQKS